LFEDGESNVLCRAAHHGPRGETLRIQASDLAAVFEVYMLAVGLGSVKTALDTSSFWYDGTISLWVYGMTLIGSLVLLTMTVLTGVVLLRARGTSVRLGSPAAAPSDRPSQSPPEVTDVELEDLLASLRQAERSRSGTGSIVAELEVREAAAGVTRDRTPGGKRRSRARRVLMTLLGPSIAAAVFCAVSAAFLPGAFGFLQNEFKLNTFAILTLSYGWPGLVGYAVASSYLAASRG
jgi:hypothetical protein